MLFRPLTINKTSSSPHLPALAGSSSTIAPYAYGVAALLASLATAAFVNHRSAKKAERDNPPIGKFVAVDGVRLHYVDRGRGETLVLLHGNGSMVQDFESSGLIAKAAETNRVIAFDRPGYGHSERPRSTTWTPAAQAQLIHRALAQLGVSRYMVLGHSWGASVAVALGLNHPEAVEGLVLESGYFYPTVRADVALLSGPAIPVLGDVLRYTVSPIVSRIMWPLLLRKMFGPAPVPAGFGAFPKEMTFRPSQIRASAAESALMIPDAMAARGHYAELKMPVAIVAGENDRIVDIERQSARLHADLPHSSLFRVPGTGHMVHQTAPDIVMTAVDRIAADAKRNRSRGHLQAAVA
ncbi:MAG: alpha/beta fold hydrolase [Rhodoplanes sp.]|jgi:pimeloyl-ACP methyl ester carboxylesterase